MRSDEVNGGGPARKRVVLYAGITSLAVLVILAVLSRDSSLWKSSHEDPPQSSPKEGSPPGTAGESTSPKVDQEPVQNAEEIRQLASTLRARCRTDKSLLRELITQLLDASQPARVREVAAFVLGSLPDPEAQAALVRALEKGGDGTWIRTLILAIGSALDNGRDNTFAWGKSPYVLSTPHGLSVKITKVLLDSAARTTVEAQISHADAGVRQAVLQALRHTLIHEATIDPQGKKGVGLADVRQTFLGVLSYDSEELLRAEAAGALAEWMTRTHPSSVGHAEVRDRLLRKSLDPQEDQVRFQSLGGLRETPLPEPDLERVYQSALQGDGFEKRTWAIKLAVAHAGALGPGRQESLIALGIQDQDAKIREITVRQIAHLPKTDETLQKALASLRDPAWNVRYAAVRTLTEFDAGPELKASLEALGRSDPNPQVRAAVRRALRSTRR